MSTTKARVQYLVMIARSESREARALAREAARLRANPWTPDHYADEAAMRSRQLLYESRATLDRARRLRAWAEGRRA